MRVSDLQISQNKDCLKTVLGSCVSVVLYSVDSYICTMSHYLLPEMPDSSYNVPNNDTEPLVEESNYWHSSTKNKNIYTYANTIIPYQIEVMLKLGCERTKLRAKIAGGATMFLHEKPINPSLDIGQRNIQVGTTILNKEHILITGKSCGSLSARSIIYDPNKRQLEVTILNGKQSQVLIV